MKRISGWWWAGGGIAVSALLIIGGIGWFHSDADLRRMRLAARAAGVATSWAEAGFHDMPAAERANLERAFAVSRRWTSLTETDPRKGPQQVEPANDALIAHHAAIPQEFWTELDAALGALPEEPLPLFERYASTTSQDVGAEQRSLVCLLAERIRLCPADDLPARVAQAARIVHVVRSQTLIQQLVDASCASILYPAVSARRGDLRGNERGLRVAAQLSALRDDLWQARLETWRGASAEVFSLYADSARLAPSSTAPGAGGAVNRLRNGLVPLVYRLDREAGLRHLIAVHVAVAGAADPADLLRRSAAVPLPEPTLPRLAEFARINPFLIAGVHRMLNVALAKTLLSLDVVAADLRGGPLPADPFSPTLAPLRPVERDGRLIGWYSVGPNGIDDGGQAGKDHGIPLSEPFGNPFADPPKPR